MSVREPDPEILIALYPLVRPFNTRGVIVTERTEFVGDLGLDSLAVMELVAVVEDRFDISMPLNLLPEITTVGDLAVAIAMMKMGVRG